MAAVVGAVVVVVVAALRAWQHEWTEMNQVSTSEARVAARVDGDKSGFLGGGEGR